MCVELDPKYQDADYALVVETRLAIVRDTLNEQKHNCGIEDQQLQLKQQQQARRSSTA
jgi:hypothetical protein